MSWKFRKNTNISNVVKEDTNIENNKEDIMCEEVVVNGATVKIESVTPVTPEEAEKIANGATATVINETTTDTEDEFLKQFSDKPVTEDPDKESRDKLKGIINYLKSKNFKKDVERKSYKTGIPPRDIARGIIGKAFGIVGDILGITVATARQTLNGLVDLLTNILHSGINLIANLVDGLCRIVTFNKTATGVC